MVSFDINEVDLIFQTGIFLVLLSGHPRFHLFHKMAGHGWIMVLATALNTVSVLVVMIPLAFIETTDIPYALTYVHPFLFVIHMTIGIVAWVIALIISLRWLVKRDVRSCLSGRVMKTSFVLWTISYAIGASTYLVHYLPLSTL